MKLKEEDWNEKLFLCTSHGSWSRLTDVRYQWGTFSNLEIYNRDCNSVFKWAFHNFKIWDLPSQARNCKRIVAAFLGFYHHFCKEKGLPYVFWLLDLLLYCSYWTWFDHSWVPLDFPSLSVPNWSWGSFLPDIRSQCLLHSLAPQLWTWQHISLVSHFILFDTGPSSRLGIPRWISGKESACNAGDLGSVLGLGRSPEEANGNPFQYSCPGNPMDRGTWRATVHGISKSRTQLSDWTQCTV